MDNAEVVLILTLGDLRRTVVGNLLFLDFFNFLGSLGVLEIENLPFSLLINI